MFAGFDFEAGPVVLSAQFQTPQYMLQSSNRGLALLNASACLEFVLRHDETTGNMG